LVAVNGRSLSCSSFPTLLLYSRHYQLQRRNAVHRCSSPNATSVQQAAKQMPGLRPPQQFPSLHTTNQGSDVNEETRPLLPDTEAGCPEVAAIKILQYGRIRKKKVSSDDKLDINVPQVCSRSLDAFKGVLVILMTYAHVDLCLMSPMLQYYSPLPHFVGNAAAGLCFLGFMLAYGFSCDIAYLSDNTNRTAAERFVRVARSALMPVAAAWVCSMAWGYICFKLPLNTESLIMILDFRLAIGNGPDFLLCFTACVLTMFPLRHTMNRALSAPALWQRLLTAVVMLVIPLMLTRLVINDCTGMKKYLNYILECRHREPYAPNLPGLPHLFYFNLGVLLSRHVKAVTTRIETESIQNIELGQLGFLHLSLALVFLILSYPLLSLWSFNYGNLDAPTQWGEVTRGFDRGPSVLWLLGNLFGINLLLTSCVGTHLLAEHWGAPYLSLAPVRWLMSELEHLGANVLMYLVVGDICMAGLYRGADFPLGAHGAAVMTLGIILVVRFIHYLGASSRPVNTGSRKK